MKNSFYTSAQTKSTVPLEQKAILPKQQPMIPAAIKTELGWQPAETFETGLRKTIKWYLSNLQWIQTVKSGAYRNWLEQNYNNR